MAEYVNGESVYGTIFQFQQSLAFSYGTVGDGAYDTSVTIGLGSGPEGYRRSLIIFLTPDEAIKFASGILDVAQAVMLREEEAAAEEYWAMLAEEEEQARIDAMLEANLEAEANYHRESDFGRFAIDA